MIEEFERGTPFYVQIFERIVDSIKSGRLTTGTRLSIRKITQEFGASRNTVERAIAVLKEQGIVDTIPKSGTVITRDAWRIVNKNTPDWGRISSQGYYLAASDLSMESRQRASGRSNVVYKLKYSFNEADFHYYAMMDDIMSNLPSKYLFNHAGSRQLQKAQTALSDHLHNYGIDAMPENIVIFNSYLHAINCIVLSIFRNGSNLYRMKPDLFGSARLFNTIGVNKHVLQHDDEGIRPDDLLHKLNNSRYNVVATTPVNHFPLGLTISEERREQLLHVFQRLNTPVLENGIFRDTYRMSPPPPFKSDDISDQIIFVGSFDLTAVNGPTWVVAHESIIKRIQDVCNQIYGAANALSCEIISRLLNDGLYYKLMEDFRRVNSMRLPKLRQILEKHLNGIAEWRYEWADYHLALKFDERVNVNKLFQECEEVIFIPGEIYHDPTYAYLNSVCESLENTEKAIVLLAKNARKQIN